MAKIHRIRPPEDIPDSSMADVAFLLLIFFIATTTIAEEFGLQLILPARASGTATKVNRDNVMVLSCDETGSVYIVDDQAVSLDAVRPMVKERQAANDKLVVSIEPHKNAPYRAMVDLLDEVKQAGATRVSLKTASGR